MPVPKGSSLDPRQTKLDVVRRAEPLLYERGLAGIGVAELCATLQISKETLYRHFGSKAGLVSAVLRARSEKVVRWMERAAAESGGDCPEQLAAVFDALEDWYASGGFRGCAILNAATQDRTGSPGDVAERHLNALLEVFTAIARRAEADDANALARQWLMLMEGATVVADMRGDLGAASAAKLAALDLLSTATRKDGVYPEDAQVRGPRTHDQ